MANGTLKVSNIETSSGSGTITLGQSGETVTVASGATNNLGITEADNWRITVFQNISADTDTLINSTWERNDTDFEKIGTGLTESSGVFTFGSTGKYLISLQVVAQRSGDTRYISGQIHISTDSGGSFSERARSFTSIKQTSAATYGSLVAACIVDVTDASTFRLKFMTGGDESYGLENSTSLQRTGFYCIRLGDT